MNDREKVLKIIVALTEAHLNHNVCKVDVPHMAGLSELTEGQIRPVLRKAYFNYDLDSPAIELLYKCTFEDKPWNPQFRTKYSVTRYHLTECVNNLRNGRDMYHHVLEALEFTNLALKGLTGPSLIYAMSNALKEVA